MDNLTKGLLLFGLMLLILIMVLGLIRCDSIDSFSKYHMGCDNVRGHFCNDFNNVKQSLESKDPTKSLKN